MRRTVELSDRVDEGAEARLLAVAELGAQRKPGPDRPWTFGAEIEQELLAAATLAAADHAQGRESEDQGYPQTPSSAFARAFVLGSAPFDAAADAAARTLRIPRPEARAAAADALALAPSPAVGAAVVRLLDGASPALAAAALGVLRFRRQAPYGAVVLFLAHPNPAVAAMAARCLGTVPERRAAASVLRHVLSRGPDDAIALPAAETLLALGEPAGLVFVREKLEAESAAPSLAEDTRVAYLRLLGLAGDARDRDLFFRSLEPTPRDAAAVGWFGHPDVIEWLLASLEVANEARHRKPGARPSPFEVAAARALQHVLGGVEGGLQAEAGPWRALWAGVRARGSDTARKLRFGRPYAPSATVDELLAEALSTSRADAALELAIVSGGASLLETDNWVARQRTVLSEARGMFDGLGGESAYPAGAFVGARLTEH